MGTILKGWCYIDGAEIPSKEKDRLYGTLINLKNEFIFYGAPSVRIYNGDLLEAGVIYKLVPLTDLPHGSNFGSIAEIDANHDLLINDINNYDKDLRINHQIAKEEFAVQQSSVIFYCASNENIANRYTIIYADEDNTPAVISITGKYNGVPIPVSDTFNIADFEIYAIYANGQKARLIYPTYQYEPSDNIIRNVGSNVITVTYQTNDGRTLTNQFIITGIQKLEDIRAYYDSTAPKVTIGQSIERKYVVVVAMYSDGSEAVVSDYTFPEGTIVSERNGGSIPVMYKNKTKLINVPLYEVSTSRLMAYYTGPNIEIGNEFDIHRTRIKIYYKSANNLNGHYEDINPEDCEFSTTTISHEGINQILVSYVGRLGVITTYMAVIGIKPEVILNFIDVEYVGPDIVVGKSFSQEYVIVKAHYSNGDVIQVDQFTINSNTVMLEGENVFTATYNDQEGGIKDSTFVVIGIPKDSTTEDGYSPVSLDNNYPEATRYNNRFRGPAESIKHDRLSRSLYANISKLYNIFYSIEKDFNDIINDMSDSSAMKYTSLNTAKEIDISRNTMIYDERFATGHYQPIGE